MKQKEIGWGVLLAYMLIFLNILYNLAMIPFILRFVDASSYGVYKSVASISATMAVMDFGLGSTLTRYLARFHAENDKRSAQNFTAMVFLQYVVLASLIICIGVLSYHALDTVYQSSFSQTEIILARRLLVLLIVNLILKLFENMLFGIANSFERFRMTNLVRLLSLILKAFIVLAVLPRTKDVVTVVLSETLITIVSIGVIVFYIVGKLRFTPCLYRWDKRLFRESFGYTLQIFLQSLTMQINGNVDSVLIGAMIGSTPVTVYSTALIVFNMYENLATTLSGMLLPHVTQKIVAGVDDQQLQRIVEQVGRYQFILLGGVLGAFIVLGRNFIYLWLGEQFSDCYLLVLILIIPATLLLTENTALTILRAQNRMKYRTVTLLCSTLLNVIMTVYGIRLWGYWGAAIGTMIATICNFTMMNVYYHRQLHFKIGSLLARITAKTLPWIMVVSGLVFALNQCLTTSWRSFAMVDCIMKLDT